MMWPQHSFLSVVSQIDDSRYVRVKTVDFSDRVRRFLCIKKIFFFKENTL